MPEFKSTTATAQEAAGTNAANMISTADLISGKSQFLQCAVTVPAGTTTSDTIVLGYIPAGATIVPGLITVQTTVVCGANAFDIGVDGASDAVADGLVCNTLNTQSVISANGSLKYTVRTALIATLSGGTLTSGGTFFVNIPLVNSN